MPMMNKDRATLVGKEKTPVFILARYYATLVAEKTVMVNLPLKAVLVQNKIVSPFGRHLNRMLLAAVGVKGHGGT